MGRGGVGILREAAQDSGPCAPRCERYMGFHARISRERVTRPHHRKTEGWENKNKRLGTPLVPIKGQALPTFSGDSRASDNSSRSLFAVWSIHRYPSCISVLSPSLFRPIVLSTNPSHSSLPPPYSEISTGHISGDEEGNGSGQ